MFSLQGMYDWSINQCVAPRVGYNQFYRNQITVDGITYYDCSSFTFFAVWLGGGYDVGQLGFPNDLNLYHTRQANAWVVSSSERYLPLIGFTCYQMSEAYPEPGDIMIKIATHTEICYSREPFVTMGARNSHLDLADQVAVHSSDMGYWDRFWRYGDTPPEPRPPVPPTPHEKSKIWFMLKPYWKYGFR